MDRSAIIVASGPFRVVSQFEFSEVVFAPRKCSVPKSCGIFTLSFVQTDSHDRKNGDLLFVVWPNRAGNCESSVLVAGESQTKKCMLYLAV